MRLAELIATAGGIGRWPIAPGTWGSLVGLVVGLAVLRLPVFAQWLLLVAAFYVGVWASTVTERALNTTDPGCVVVDEVWGMWAIISVFGTSRPLWAWALGGFILFRLFDVIKPPPLRWLEQCPAGWGIMLDDAGAAVYASLVLVVARRLGG